MGGNTPVIWRFQDEAKTANEPQGQPEEFPARCEDAQEEPGEQADAWGLADLG